jgi:hypothetical protein
MYKKKFSIRIASDSSKEKVFAEIDYDGDQWSEISQEKKEPVVIFFSPSNTKYWEFPLKDAMSVIEQATKKLLED